MHIKRWKAENGYRQAMVLGLPLVISMVSSSVMTFTDRIFLGGYSLDALAASLPASIAAFLFLSFFFGVVEYVGVFVSQYTGATRHERVGAALWQGLWFCVPSGLFLASLWFVAGPLFALAGHPPEVQELEVAYFRILTLGGGPFLVGVCLSCFFSGRGMTKPVMIVNTAATVLNIPLDYCLINGIGPFPELGIVGAGIATLAPLPEVPAGDVDLYAPLGTIDAGEAGIRVSGNVNIAALQVVNAANIQAQGDSKGVPVTASVNTGALSSASAAATSAVN
ncbi:MAG: filamentous hemagglutinin family protein, partial [Proteobacteria bacterium]|nr:filamentous hemagglutinin family protein [Pseudomonadota bacterium]